ncbi:MAG: SDR family oxidoreductase [Verrucomicrobia bacterium]|nr:SDR family oxidoreductase [Verrucomicrobiota bacterium]
MTRVLLTGAAGVVGSALARCFSDPAMPLIRVDRPGREANGTIGCDLADPAAVARLIAEQRPDAVLHLAGNKDVFALEKAPALARQANVDTTRNLVDAIAGRDCFFVYLSTDYVFEGTAGPYSETSPAAPRTEYGKSKLAAEHLLSASSRKYAIARSSSIFGYPRDFVSLVLDTLRKGQPFPAFSDLVSNPTYLGTLFEMLRRIISRRSEGVFHTCGSHGFSREAFARKIAAAFNLNAGLIRGETRSERIRPADLSLDNTATCAALGYRPLALEQILSENRAQWSAPDLSK